MVAISWVWNAKYLHVNRTVLVKMHVSRTAGCRDSSSHSFSKRATVSGIAKGGRGYASILQKICCYHVFFQAENVQKPFSAGARSPRTPLGSLRVATRSGFVKRVVVV